MTHEEFVKEYTKITIRALKCSYKSKKEGLLALEGDLDPVKNSARDIFDYGMQFIVDGIDDNFLDKVLSNIVKQEKDEYNIILKTIKKEAVLAIQAGMDTYYLYLLLNSYTDIPIKDDEIYNKIYKEDSRHRAEDALELMIKNRSMRN